MRGEAPLARGPQWRCQAMCPCITTRLVPTRSRNWPRVTTTSSSCLVRLFVCLLQRMIRITHARAAPVRITPTFVHAQDCSLMSWSADLLCKLSSHITTLSVAVLFLTLEVNASKPNTKCEKTYGHSHIYVLLHVVLH